MFACIVPPLGRIGPPIPYLFILRHDTALVVALVGIVVAGAAVVVAVVAIAAVVAVVGWDCRRYQ